MQILNKDLFAIKQVLNQVRIKSGDTIVKDYVYFKDGVIGSEGIKFHVQIKLPSGGVTGSNDVPFLIQTEELGKVVGVLPKKVSDVSDLRIDRDKDSFRIAGKTGIHEIAAVKVDEDYGYEHLAYDANSLKFSIDVDTAKFLENIKKVGVAMGKDNVRYYLNSMKFEITSGNKLTLVATDGHRLATTSQKIGVVRGEGTEDFLIPRVAIEALVMILSKAKSSIVRLGVLSVGGRKNFSVQVGSVMLRGIQVDGQYPDWRGAFPKENTTELRVYGREIMQMADWGIASEHIKMEVGKTSMTATHGSSKSGAPMRGKIEIKVNCNKRTEDSVFNFNSKYLKDVVKWLQPNDIVTMKGTGTQTAATIVSPGDYSALIMQLKDR